MTNLIARFSKKGIAKFLISWWLIMMAINTSGLWAIIPATCIFIWGYARGDLNE